jgi:hypothetical protein
MPREARCSGALLLGHGRFLPAEVCRAVVGDVTSRAWWQWSEIGEAGQSGVDPTSCRSRWCWLVGDHRTLVVNRLAAIAASLRDVAASPRLEEPVVLRYGRGGFFRRHSDQYEQAGNARGRRMSLVAFLTGQGEPGGYAGGDLVFYVRGAVGETVVRFPGRSGQFVVFAAHVEHEVLPVVAGDRFTLVSWLY